MGKSNFVESLRRLYIGGKVAEEKISDLHAREMITEEDYNYIVSESEKPSSDDSDLQAFYDAVTQEVGV